MYDGIQKAYEKMRFKNDVVFTGHLDSKELSELMPGASAMTFVSHFEGFGIPLIEAMSCNVPVITSDNSSLKEVAGDAALLVDSQSTDSIAKAMNSIVCDTDLRTSLIEKGSIRTKEFSWDKTAQLLWDSINKSLDQ